MCIERFQEIAERVSHAFEGCWWADEEDLKSEAFAALLEADQKGQLTDRKEATIYFIALRHAGALIRRTSAPVHIPWGARKKLALFHRAPIDDLETKDAEQERHVWHVAVRERLATHGLSVAVERVLLWQEAPAEVAEALDVDVAVLYNQLQQARRKLANDRKLEALWKDRP